MSFSFVALGGALGAVARYAISLIPVKTVFIPRTERQRFIPYTVRETKTGSAS